MPAVFRVEEGILVVTLTGEMTDAENCEARRACAELCRQQDVSRMLIDLRGAVIRSSLLDTYLFVTSLAEGFPPDTLYAVLFSPETHDPDRARFSEDVAAKRGIRVKMFTREDEAREWLRRGRGDRGTSPRARAGDVR